MWIGCGQAFTWWRCWCCLASGAASCGWCWADAKTVRVLAGPRRAGLEETSSARLRLRELAPVLPAQEERALAERALECALKGRSLREPPDVVREARRHIVRDPGARGEHQRATDENVGYAEASAYQDQKSIPAPLYEHATRIYLIALVVG
jgi:hypothetical protein